MVFINKASERNAYRVTYIKYRIIIPKARPVGAKTLLVYDYLYQIFGTRMEIESNGWDAYGQPFERMTRSIMEWKTGGKTR